MTRLQEVFDRLQGIKKEQRELRAAYREALEQTPAHKEAKEEIRQLREKKKRIEDSTRADFSKEFSRIDRIKVEIEGEQELLSDLALNKLAKGETVELTDQYDNQYEPVFSVKFKKIK